MIKVLHSEAASEGPRYWRTEADGTISEGRVRLTDPYSQMSTEEPVKLIADCGEIHYVRLTAVQAVVIHPDACGIRLYLSAGQLVVLDLNDNRRALGLPTR